jgi:hypothetical protein
MRSLRSLRSLRTCSWIQFRIRSIYAAKTAKLRNWLTIPSYSPLRCPTYTHSLYWKTTNTCGKWAKDKIKRLRRLRYSDCPQGRSEVHWLHGKSVTDCETAITWSAISRRGRPLCLPWVSTEAYPYHSCKNVCELDLRSSFATHPYMLRRLRNCETR